MPMRCLHIATLPLMLACAWSGAYSANGMPPAALLTLPAGVPERGVDPLPRAEAPSGKPVSAATEKKIRSFLDHFVDANKNPAEMGELLADDVQYYERGAVGKDEIVRETARYNKHWPYRRFRVTEISYMNADPQSNGVFVAYTVDFEVANSMRAISGKAHYAALIEDPDGTPKMKAIRERVTRRLPGSPDADSPAQD